MFLLDETSQKKEGLAYARPIRPEKRGEEERGPILLPFFVGGTNRLAALAQDGTEGPGILLLY